MWNSLTRYHPRIGFTYMPSVKSRVPWETGGYLVRTNAAGFRSEREFVGERPAGTFRAILFGDSQTAGDGVANADRYSDVVETLVPGLEVYNYGIPGTGTDQQYLSYLECADVEHDLVIIGLHVENIGTVANRFRVFINDLGQEVIYAKPYYTLDQGWLVLGHVPVPKVQMTRATLSPDDVGHVHWGVPLAGLRNVVKKLGMRELLQKVTRFQPVPEYDAPDNERWILLRAILEEWIRGSRTPVLLFLVPIWPFIEESSDPTNYQARFRELAEATGCYLHDPLPDLWKYTPAERRAFRFKVDPHFSPAGHRAMAQSLAGAIERVMGS
ncbi:MAG: SGNH/GDSL hydrolase family protein [Pirellulales bacterium]